MEIVSFSQEMLCYGEFKADLGQFKHSGQTMRHLTLSPYPDHDLPGQREGGSDYEPLDPPSPLEGGRSGGGRGQCYWEAGYC